MFNNSVVPYIGDYVRIIAAICNAFRPPRVFDNAEDSSRAQKLKNRYSKLNKLEERVRNERLATRTACWEDVTDETLPDFPELTFDELKDITLGIYQVTKYL